MTTARPPMSGCWAVVAEAVEVSWSERRMRPAQIPYTGFDDRTNASVKEMSEHLIKHRTFVLVLSEEDGLLRSCVQDIGANSHSRDNELILLLRINRWRRRLRN